MNHFTLHGEWRAQCLFVCRVFEFQALFPIDSLLTVQIFDYDALSADDLIGQTFIDLEDRLNSRHRAHCGLADTYELYFKILHIFN